MLVVAMAATTKANLKKWHFGWFILSTGVLLKVVGSAVNLAGPKSMSYHIKYHSKLCALYMKYCYSKRDHFDQESNVSSYSKDKHNSPGVNHKYTQTFHLNDLYSLFPHLYGPVSVGFYMNDPSKVHLSVS